MTERKLKVKLTEDSSAWSSFARSGDAALNQIEGSVSKFAGKMKTGFVAVGVAAAAALVKGFDEAMDREAASDKMAARMGLDPEQAGRLGSLAGDIYAGAWGESLGEVNLAIEG